MQESSEQ
jgi:superfamily II DNA helicase RecQ